jgi:peroxiredoxin
LLIAASTTCGNDEDGQTPAKASPGDLVGKTAPDLVAEEVFNGPTELSFQKLRGKVVVVNFWLRSCPICMKNLARMQALHNKYEKSGLVVIGIHMAEESEAMSDWLKDRGVTYPVAIDKGDTAKEYSLGEFPTYFLVNGAGKVVKVLTKQPPTDQQIEELLGS